MDEQEQLLRDTLRDDRWALPPRPGSAGLLLQRARGRAARRRVSVAVALVLLLVAVAVPVALGRHGRRARLTTTTPTPTPAHTGPPTPGVGFPAAVYPRPLPVARGSELITACPNPRGLQSPVVRNRSEVTAALTLLARGTSTPLDAELAVLDRTEWTQYAASRAEGGPAGTANLLYAAPLLAGGFSAYGPPDVAATITAACGATTAADSYAAVEGPAGSPALQEVYLFVRRGGRLLAYFEYP